MGQTLTKKKEPNWDSQETVEAINKRTLGKLIIKECGHEGAENTIAQQYLRKLLQGCIDSLQKYPKIDWSNVTLEVSGIDGKQYQIVAGKGKLRVFALLDSKDEICIVEKQQVWLFSDLKTIWPLSSLSFEKGKGRVRSLPEIDN